MKTLFHAILVSIFSLVALINLNAQPPANPSTQTPGGERRRNSPAMVDKRVESDNMRANQPQVYELRCRGGKDLTFPAQGSRVHSSGAVIVTLELEFAPSLQAAGVNSGALQPGECALAERPFYRDEVGQIREPFKVRLETPVNAQLKQTQSGSEVDKSPTAAERFPDAITIARYMTNPNHFWSFRVINTGKGYFETQSHQHWKKMLEDMPIPKKNILIRPL